MWGGACDGRYLISRETLFHSEKAGSEGALASRQECNHSEDDGFGMKIATLFLED
jgi:hypothetical protein